MCESICRSVPEYLTRIAEVRAVGEIWIFRGQPLRDKDGVECQLKPAAGRERPWFSESKAFEEFKRLAAEIKPEIASYLDLDMLALARHHGVPTRLLDWTVNPLVALYFAIEETQESENAAVWCYQSGRISPIPDYLRRDPFGAAKGVMAFWPPAVSPRVAAQSSVMTCHEDPTVAMSPPEFHLVKLTVAKNDDMEDMLRQLSMDCATLYKDFDHVGIAATSLARREAPVSSMIASTTATVYRPPDSLPCWICSARLPRDDMTQWRCEGPEDELVKLMRPDGSYLAHWGDVANDSTLIVHICPSCRPKLRGKPLTPETLREAELLWLRTVMEDDVIEAALAAKDAIESLGLRVGRLEECASPNFCAFRLEIKANKMRWVQVGKGDDGKIVYNLEPKQLAAPLMTFESIEKLIEAIKAP